jgi:hypothetical protein
MKNNISYKDYMKMPKSSKYTFTLTNIDIVKVHKKYNLRENNENCVKQEKCTTKLTDLNNDKCTPEIISFLDEAKKSHTCYVSMIDFSSKMNINLLRYHCFWCKHPFETQPIGCPINYVSPQAVKKYHSHISKELYTIKENITCNRKNKINNDNIYLNFDEYYETDGVFCSFNCCKSYILNNKHDRMYDHSEMLLTKMYNELLKTKNVTINSAPHWRLLEQYGGHLNIIQFRDSFNNIDYEFHGQTKKLPNFLAVGTMYEEKIKF